MPTFVFSLVAQRKVFSLLLYWVNRLSLPNKILNRRNFPKVNVGIGVYVMIVIEDLLHGEGMVVP